MGIKPVFLLSVMSFPHFPQVFPQGAKRMWNIHFSLHKFFEIYLKSPNFLPNYHFANTPFAKQKIPP